jgi:hypothetical protein
LTPEFDPRVPVHWGHVPATKPVNQSALGKKIVFIFMLWIIMKIFHGADYRFNFFLLIAVAAVKRDYPKHANKNKIFP